VNAVSGIEIPDPIFGEGIKVVCVLKGFNLNAAARTEFVASRIALYKNPRHGHFDNTLPMAADGSINRAKVKILYG